MTIENEKNEKKNLNELILEKANIISDLRKEIHKKVIWQENLIHILLVGLITEWHILLEWVPGIAKTLTVDTLSKALHGKFQRIQFTPDLLPSDLIGTEIYNQWSGKFKTKKWPIFTNFLLADEINRASSKVQSALLEVMAEQQVTIWEETYKIDDPFLVLATQNPIEQSGTYKLPEAQLDRFMLKINVGYPKESEEKEIMKNIYKIEEEKINTILKKEELYEIQSLVKQVYVSENILDYINNIIFSSRYPEKYNLHNISKYINYGFSPRGSISLMKSAQANAFLEGRDFVLPEDVKYMAQYTLTHRLVTNYEAIADNISNEDIIRIILDSIKIK